MGVFHFHSSSAHQKGGLKSAVEYHQEERKNIQEQLEALEGKRELIQCDLNNARSKGKHSIGVVGRGCGGMGGWTLDGIQKCQ